MSNPTFSYLGLSGPRTLGWNLGLARGWSAFEVEGFEVEGFASTEELWVGSTSIGESSSLSSLSCKRVGFSGSSGSRRSLHLQGNL